jgi:hypothetical protein
MYMFIHKHKFMCMNKMYVNLHICIFRHIYIYIYICIMYVGGIVMKSKVERSRNGDKNRLGSRLSAQGRKVCIYMYVCTCVCISVYIYIHVYTYINTYVCIRIDWVVDYQLKERRCIYTCMCVRVYVYLYTYIYIYI